MIESIDFKLNGWDEKRAIIKLESKNLIITGENGCGKTRFLHQLYTHLQQLFSRKIQTHQKITQEINTAKQQLNHLKPSDQYFTYWSTQIEQGNKKLAQLSNEIIEVNNLESLFVLVNENKFILRFFEANRLANGIAGNGQIASISSIKNSGSKADYKTNLNNQFENYLVSFYNYGSHVKARENDVEKSHRIDEWFAKIETDLQDLFEDSHLKLQYKAEEQAFYLHQDGKEPYRFNTLSSGYSSILSIYADLLMAVELKDLPADQITGFVFIDEIDAHLHVSIQRKIFSFFSKAFPKIQFITSTHSPFVVQSVNDAVIYDLSKLEQLEDLSMYSYESILKGLLGVDSTSDLLNEKIEEMASVINKLPFDNNRLKELIESIEPYEEKLDSRSKAFLLLGKNALLDSNNGEG